jgi:oligopeptidase B
MFVVSRNVVSASLSSPSSSSSSSIRYYSILERLRDWFYSTDMPVNRGLFQSKASCSSSSSYDRNKSPNYTAFPLNPHLQANNPALIKQLKIPKSPILQQNEQSTLQASEKVLNSAASPAAAIPNIPNIETPFAIPDPTFQTHHSILRADNFTYLESSTNPLTAEYLQAENSYTNVIMNVNTPNSIQSQVEAEIHNRPETEVFAENAGGYSYTVLYDRPVPRYCRVKLVSPTNNTNIDQVPDLCEASPHLETVLDLTSEYERHRYVHVGQLRFDRKHNWLAYTLDKRGNERYDLIIKNLVTHKELSDEIVANVVSCAWNYDSTAVYYTLSDEFNRPYCLKQHILGTPVAHDSILFVESSTNQIVDMNLSKDRHYLFISSANRTSSDILILNTHSLAAKPYRLWPRNPAITYSLEHNHGNFIVITNAEAPNNRILLLPTVNVFDEEQWGIIGPHKAEKIVAPTAAGECKVLIPHRKHVKLLDIDVFDEFLVLYESEKGLPRIRVQQINGNNSGEAHYVALPSVVGEVLPGMNSDFRSEVLRFSFSSPIHPNLTFDYNMKSKELRQLNDAQQLQAEKEFYGLDKLTVQRLEVPIENSSSSSNSLNNANSIPLTLVYPKTMQQNCQNPVLIEVYGSYGANMSLEFNPFHALLLKRGWVVAKSHVRGGGELGFSHHNAGRAMHKLNSVQDFIETCQFLKNNKYTNSDLLFGYAASAGGLVMASAINKTKGQKLLNGVVLRVPFVDPLSSMLALADSPVNSIEQAEFGCPLSQVDQFHYLHAYSPYQNLPSSYEQLCSSFPSLFVFTSLYDSRVPYWQPLKYIAKLRQLQASKLQNYKLNIDHSEEEQQNGETQAKNSSNAREPLILLSAADFGGHLGSSLERVREESLQLAFYYKILGWDWHHHNHNPNNNHSHIHQ